jgi:hypothetical protein
MNVWTPLCALKFTAPLASDLCSYMGYSASLNFTLVRPNQTAIADYQAPLQEVNDTTVLYGCLNRKHGFDRVIAGFEWVMTMVEI